jgi:Domain of unknown function (DUF3510)
MTTNDIQKKINKRIILTYFRYLQVFSSVGDMRDVYRNFITVKAEFENNLSPRIGSRILSNFLGKVLGLDDLLQSRITSTFSDIFHSFDLAEIEVGIVSNLSTSVIETMVQGCNGVASLYRRTNREKPTTSGYYVKDLISFDDPIWRKKCRVYVLENYASTVQKCLVNIKNVEESLKKLKKRRMNVSGLGSGSNEVQADGNIEDSDEFKMRLQFQIDLQHVLKDCELDEVGLLDDLKTSIQDSLSVPE